MEKGFDLLDVLLLDGRRVVVLSDEIAHALGVEDGDQVVATLDDDGSVTLAPGGSEFAVEMAVARQVMRDRRVVLHDLARS